MQDTAKTDTRERLLDTAARLMWERSYQATGVDDLCVQAGAKKGSFYHFFPSKSDLAIASIERLWGQVEINFFQPIFSSNDGGMTQLRQLVQQIYEFQKQLAGKQRTVAGCPFGNLGQEMARQDERIRASLQRIFDAHCAYIEQALHRAEQASEIPKGDNTRRARNIFAMLEGALLLAKVANDPEVLRQMLPAMEVVAAT